MWVSSLEINNIKSFEQSGTIKLDKKMNILLGANNSGKSTVLRVLYLMQNIQSLSLSDVRIGTTTTSCLIQLEEVETNQYLASMVHGGFLPRIEVTGSRGNSGQLAVTMVKSDNSQRNSINISAVEPYNCIYPYLSKRKVQGYSREVRRHLVLEVSGSPAILMKLACLVRNGRMRDEIALICDLSFGVLLCSHLHFSLFPQD